jgi:hypothetical protein
MCMADNIQGESLSTGVRETACVSLKEDTFAVG